MSLLMNKLIFRARRAHPFQGAVLALAAFQFFCMIDWNEELGLRGLPGSPTRLRLALLIKNDSGA